MKLKDYILFIILLLIASINFNLFIKPNNLVSGGTASLAIIVKHFINLSYSEIILIINMLMLVLSLIFISKKMSLGIILSSFIYPIFVNLTSVINVNISNLIILSIIIGIISGLTNGFIYKLGFSSGGLNLIGPLFNKYYNIKIGTVNLIVNLIILFFNFFLFGFLNLIYSIIIIVINSFVINIVLSF